MPMVDNRLFKDQYQLRLPDGMRDELRASAKSNGRTLNAEIVARLAEGGKTLRDEFAMAALKGLLAGQFSDPGHYNLKELPEEAYEIANAMLAARGGDHE